MLYKQLFNSDTELKYIEIDTLRKCYWDMPYNPDKFELKDGKIRCKQAVTKVQANDLPLLHYYSRDMKEHVITDISEMFKQCNRLKSLNANNWNVSNVTDMRNMFYYCKQLQFLDVSNWNTSNVTNMIGMFSNCKKLQSLDISKWDTRSVTSMCLMFSNCKQLQSLDISKWNVSKVIDMCMMFCNCTIQKPSWYHE